jgi:hypothetical protein
MGNRRICSMAVAFAAAIIGRAGSKSMESAMKLGALQKVAGEGRIKRRGQSGNNTHADHREHQ